MARLKKSKIAKYGALAFAALLLCGIISIFASLLSTEDLAKEPLKAVALQEQTVTSLEIDVGGMEFTLAKGETLSAQTNNEDVRFTQTDGKLKIKEEHSGFSKKINGKLILYMPALTFDDVTIKTGAGKVEIESITAKTLSFTFGAGEVAIGQLSVSVNANIETGAGKFTVASGLVSNLDLDLGVGETLLKCDLLGESELNCGVGQVSLTLSKKEDYTLKLDKGIGTIKVDGVSLSGGAVVGQGTNIVEIDGGIGEIAVTFTE